MFETTLLLFSKSINSKELASKSLMALKVFLNLKESFPKR